MARSDVNMSSEVSECSSRLRQFGLYKTIDSRTAEFLKLSRKRQIRRGCACAVVSTAITVTVVVSAVLVYEYGFQSESKMAPTILSKFNWFNTINDSDITFDKTNAALDDDKNNKLLSIILKSLDQKRYLETLVQEHSSKTPSHEITTDYPIKKNIFTKVRNWQLSPMKIHEMGYKSSPQKFIKTRRKDGFAETKKIIDYQRVITYLNTLSVKKKVDETIPDDDYNPWKPTDHNENHKNNTKKNKTKNTKRMKVTGQKHISKENELKYCKCNHTSLRHMLKQLHESIQQLRPKIIETTPKTNEVCCRHKPEKYSTVSVQQPTATLNIINSNHKTKPSGHIIKSFPQISHKSHHNISTVKPKMTKSTESSIPRMQSHNTDKAKKTTNTQSTVLSEYNKIPHKDGSNSYEEEEMIWDLDFKMKGDRITTDLFIEPLVNTHTQKTTTNAMNIRTTTKVSESDAIQYTQNNQNFDNDEHDFADEIDNLQPEYRHFNAQPTPKHKEQNKTFENYNYLSKYMNELSKLDTKTFIVNKPQTVSYEPSPTVRPFELLDFFSNENDSVVKLGTTSAELNRSLKPILWSNARNNTERVILPLLRPNEIVKNKHTSASPTVHTPEELYEGPELEENMGDDKEPHETVLLPMIHSYLISGQKSDILNLNAETTTNVIELSTVGSEELPFDIKLFSNEENEQTYISRFDSLHTTMSPNTENKTHPKTITSTERTQVKAVNETKWWKKLNFLSSERTQRVTNYPKQIPKEPKYSNQKSYKNKEIFYMTGETPVDNFEDNLHELMYFDRSPVNYTALTDFFLTKSDSNSIEMTRSMVPEMKPTYLEIRRNHDDVDFDTQLFAYEE